MEKSSHRKYRDQTEAAIGGFLRRRISPSIGQKSIELLSRSIEPTIGSIDLVPLPSKESPKAFVHKLILYPGVTPTGGYSDMRVVSQLVRLCRTILCHMAYIFLMQSSQVDAQSFHSHLACRIISVLRGLERCSCVERCSRVAQAGYEVCILAVRVPY